MTAGNINTLEYASTAQMIDKGPSRLRATLPQILASCATTFLLLDIGVSLSYPTVINSALTGNNAKSNPNEQLLMDATSASWMGSIIYLGKVAGSIFCGFASECFGRRNAMIFINVTHFITFYLFYYSDSVTKVFIANVLLGFGAGFMKAPCTTYVAEISEVSIRGVLISMTSAALTIGQLVVILLGAMIEWRKIALCFAGIQIVTTITLFLIPESPHWLVSKQRDDSALKSLRWLRGWVPQQFVQSEFNSIKRYKESVNASDTDKNSTGAAQAFKEMIRRKTLEPFFILMVIGTTTFFTGTHHLFAYMAAILKTYRSPIDPNEALIYMSIIGIAGTFGGGIGMKLMGKRKLYLISILGVTCSSLTLSIYGFLYLPPNSKSYVMKANPTKSEQLIVPLIVFCVMRFFTTITLLVPYAMLSELFSMKTRSMATGLTTIMNNLLTFIATKSFYDLEHLLDLPTTIGIYCGIGVVGLFVIFNILPETEGRTLEDIEIHFSEKNRKMTDWYITPHSSIDPKEKLAK